MALTAKQQRFVNEYFVDYNGTRAAQRAGYTGNDNTLAVTAHDLLRNPKIAEVIRMRLSEHAMTREEVLARLAEQARGLPPEYVAFDGSVNIKLLVANRKTHLIKKIRDTMWGRTYEMYSSQEALRMLGEHHAIFKGNPDNPQHVVTHTHEEWVAEQEKRRQQAQQALADFANDE